MNLILEKMLRFLYFYPPSEDALKAESQDIPSAILMILESIYYFSIILLISDSAKRKLFGVSSKWFFEDWMTSIGLLSLERSLFALNFISIIPYYRYGCYIYDNWRIVTFDPYTWPSWILCIILTDFSYYVMHRLMHEVNLFWVFHQVHHSSQTFSLVSAARRPIFAFFMDAFIIPSCFLFHPRIVFFHNYVNASVYQFWLHTEFCPKLPWPIEFIFNTPSQHRVHHGVNSYAIDKNYAGFLCIWDRMFGTYAEEIDWEKEPLRYGLTTPIQASDPLSIQLAGPYQLAKNAFFAKGMDKIRTLVYGPGWFPGANHRLGVEPPASSSPLKHYELYKPWVDAKLRVYLIMVTTISALSIIYYATDQFDAYFNESVTFLAMQCTGLILTFKTSIFPVYLEVMRVIATIAYLMISNPFKDSPGARLFYSFYYFASLYYLLWYCIWARSANINYKRLPLDG